MAMVLLRGVAATLVELMYFLWKRKLWWLVPMLVVLLMFAGLIALGTATGLGPFIYTLF
ncbi:MAG: DUF5989 family protein [Armatimonadota bacterium]|nr:DUF5989 family protein [Armatimonadota bacterium]